MLQRDDGPTSTYGYLVAVEVAKGKGDPAAVALRLAEGLTWMEGIGTVDVEQMGEIEVIDEPS